MPKRYWLVKSDPDTYGWPELVRDGRTCWDGVRNYQARNNLAAMTVGDEVLFYHSQSDKSVMGTAQVAAPAYPDPTIDDERWVAVDLAVGASFARPVSLATIKATPELVALPLVKNSRLSVMPVEPSDFKRIVKMGR